MPNNYQAQRARVARGLCRFCEQPLNHYADVCDSHGVAQRKRTRGKGKPWVKGKAGRPPKVADAPPPAGRVKNPAIPNGQMWGLMVNRDWLNRVKAAAKKHKKSAAAYIREATTRQLERDESCVND